MQMIRTLLFLSLLGAPTVFAAALTIEDYVTMPTLSDVRLSPDGQRIAYVVTRADMTRSAYDSDIWIVGTRGEGARQITHSRGNDTQPRWSPDGKRLAFVSERDGAANIYVIDPDGGEGQKLTDEKVAVRRPEWSPDGSAIAFLRNDERSPEDERRIEEKDDARVVGTPRPGSHLHVLDVETKKSRRITGGNFSIFDFSWAPDGKALAFDRAANSTLDEMYRTDLYLVSVSGGEPRPLVVRPGIDRTPVFSPDGKSIAFRSGGGVHDWLREHRLSIVSIDGRSIRTIGDEYQRTPEAFSWSADSRTVWFEGPLDTTTQLFRVNADGSGFTNVSNYAGLIADVDVNRGTVAFVRQSLSSPPEIAVSPTTNFTPRVITSHNAKYAAATLGETRVVRWKNPTDGLTIEGLLTLPVGYQSGRKYPLLTFVHGGPASRFDEGFLGYLGHIYPPHVFASKGFAVLRPNPRGTGGYGERFRQANRNDWAGLDWIDINAGIDMVVSQGIADPDRLGLMGWSYGGFIASWALGHSERFKAVSIGAPVVDLLSFHGTTDIRDFIPGYFPPMPLALDAIRKRSPLWHLKPTSAVVLIQHGEADDRVPLSQGTMLYRVLNELGVDVTMVTYPRTPHTPREPKLRLDVARRNVELFTRVLLK